MFIKNKYYRWYTEITDRGMIRGNNINGYVERHHIIPKSLGGDNAKDNLVCLTAREHFICHWLLTKCVIEKYEQKVKYALWMMMHVRNEHQENRYRVNSHTYKLLKEQLAIVYSRQQAGKVCSPETRRKISETRKRLIREGKLKVNENKEKYKIIAKKRMGYIVSEETKSRISSALTGRKLSKEHKAILSEVHKGKKHTEATKEKISKNHVGFTGRKHSETTKAKLRKPYSLRQIAISTGKSTYLSAKKCKNNHASPRWTLSANCVACSKKLRTSISKGIN